MKNETTYNARKLTAMDIFEYMVANATEQQKKEFKAATITYETREVSDWDEKGQFIPDDVIEIDGKEITIRHTRMLYFPKFNINKAQSWFAKNFPNAKFTEVGKKMKRINCAADLFENW